METIEITDYKCFSGQKVKLKNLTVFAGSNSVGKSSVIQSLLLSRALYENSKGTQAFGQNKLPLNGPFQLELGNSAEVYRRGKRESIDNIISFVLEDNGSKIFDIKLSANRANTNTFHLDIISNSFTGSEGFLSPYFYYLSAERIGPRLKYQFNQLQFSHSGYRGENTFQILSEENVKVEDDRLFSAGEAALLFTQARLWLDYIIPGSNFDSAIPSGKSGIIEGTFGESLPTNVGFGISYCLPIIVNGLIAKNDSYLIIENPEAHLHPSGQSRMGFFLANIANAGVKVIIETHSEHIINGMRIAMLTLSKQSKTKNLKNDDFIVNFLKLNPLDKNIIIDEIEVDSKGDLNKFPKDFFDQVQQDLAKIIILKR